VRHRAVQSGDEEASMTYGHPAAPLPPFSAAAPLPPSGAVAPLPPFSAAAPLRPLGAAEILDGAVRLLRRNFRACLTIAVPFAIATAAFAAWLQYVTLGSKDATSLSGIAALLLTTAFGVVLGGLLAPLYSADLLGQRISAAQSLRRVGGRAWSLAVLSLVVTVAEGAALAALVVGGVWLWGVWAVAGPALVLERTGVGGALRRSRELVRDSFWRTWGIRALGWVLRSVLAALITVPFELIALAISGANPFDTNATVSHPAIYVALLAVGTVLSTALLFPVSAAIDVLLYTDLRMRKEGMDIVLGLPPISTGAGVAQPAATAW
jgi:hypothetical protein